MAAQYRSHSVGGYNILYSGAIPSVAKPAGVVAGDILIAFVTGYHSSQALDVTFPTGFTIVTADNFLTNWTDGSTGSWGWKVATDSEPANYYFTINNREFGEAELNIAAFMGVNTTTPITSSVVTTNTASNTTPVSVVLTGVTPAAGDCLIYYAASDLTSDTSVWSYTSIPSGFTQRINSHREWVDILLATKDNVSAGATGNLTSVLTRTSGSDVSAFDGWVIALKSAAGSGSVTVGLTGQALITSRGTIGYSSGGNVSTPISNAGISTTVSQGTLKANIDKVIPNTANVATTSLQTLPTISSSKPLTGQINIISQGTTSSEAGSARSAQIGGIANTISSGILKANISKPLSTSLITTGTGIVTRSGADDETTVALTGSQITASSGNIKNDRTKALTSQNTIITTTQVLQASGGKSRTVSLFGQSTYTLSGNLTPNYIAPKRGVLSIQNDIQSLAPDALVDLFELDTTKYAGGNIYRFHADVNSISTNVVWQTNTYEPFPIEVTGFESSGTGSPARPKVRVANISGYIGALTLSMNDLVGCKFTRKRTFAKYLDAVNFVGGVNATADVNAHFPDEIFYIDRKSSENNLIVEFELASVLDMNGILLPRRDVIRNNCAWRYKSAECGYLGTPVADEYDNLCIAVGGVIPNELDKCGKRFNSCELRFGTGVLAFGAFPAVGLIR